MRIVGFTLAGRASTAHRSRSTISSWLEKPMNDGASPNEDPWGEEGSWGEGVGGDGEGKGDSGDPATGPTTTSSGIFTGCGDTTPTTTSSFSISTSSSSSKYSSYWSVVQQRRLRQWNYDLPGSYPDAYSLQRFLEFLLIILLEVCKFLFFAPSQSDSYLPDETHISTAESPTTSNVAGQRIQKNVRTNEERRLDQWFF